MEQLNGLLLNPFCINLKYGVQSQLYSCEKIILSLLISSKLNGVLQDKQFVSCCSKLDIKPFWLALYHFIARMFLNVSFCIGYVCKCHVESR